MKLPLCVFVLVATVSAGYVQTGGIGNFGVQGGSHGGYGSGWTPGISSGAVHSSGIIGNYAGTISSGRSLGSLGAGHGITLTSGYSVGGGYNGHNVGPVGSVSDVHSAVSPYAFTQANVGGYTTGVGSISGHNFGQSYNQFTPMTAASGPQNLGYHGGAPAHVQPYTSQANHVSIAPVYTTNQISTSGGTYDGQHVGGQPYLPNNQNLNQIANAHVSTVYQGVGSRNGKSYGNGHATSLNAFGSAIPSGYLSGSLHRVH